MEIFHQEKSSRHERKVFTLSKRALLSLIPTHIWDIFKQDKPSFSSCLWVFLNGSNVICDSEERDSRLSGFSWPSLWVFSLQQNPIGYKLKLGIFSENLVPWATSGSQCNPIQSSALWLCLQRTHKELEITGKLRATSTCWEFFSEFLVTQG